MVDAFEEKAIMEVQSTPDEDRAAEESVGLGKLDLCIVDCEPQITSVEELESFIVDSQNPPKSL